jgi:hypothetical protein
MSQAAGDAYPASEALIPSGVAAISESAGARVDPTLVSNAIFHGVEFDAVDAMTRALLAAESPAPSVLH